MEEIEKAFVNQIILDVNAGDYTAIHEMLKLLLNDDKSREIILAYLPE